MNKLKEIMDIFPEILTLTEPFVLPELFAII